MALTFTVEDGTGLAAANSYLSVNDLKDYWTLRGVALADTYSDTVLQVALVKATDYVERRFLKWRGQRYSTTQALSWPRVYAYDSDGNLQSGVPVYMQNAIAEYAYRALTTVLMPDPTADTSGLQVTHTKIGPIEQDFQPGAVKVLKDYPAADRLLDKIINQGGGVIRA